MKKITLKTTALCLLALALFSGCKKEEGPKGETGPAGPAGTAGTAGNANVKGSTFTNLTWVFNNANLKFETVISYSAITQDIVNTGAVLVYIESNGNMIELPYSFMYDPSTILFFDFEHFVGGVRIRAHNSDLDNSIVPQSTTKFKIVAISSSALQKKQGIDGKSSPEVSTLISN